MGNANGDELEKGLEGDWTELKGCRGGVGDGR